MLSWQSSKDNFATQLAAYKKAYPDWRTKPAPAWFPDATLIANANVTPWLTQRNFTTVQQLQQWSYEHYPEFWAAIIATLNIKLQTPYQQIADIGNGIEHIRWLPGATLNIADSCFNATPSAIAIIERTALGEINHITYQHLNTLSNQVANSLQAHGFKPGAAIAIDMCMDSAAVAIYLGIIKAGCVAVSIADSFAAPEVQTRLEIANTQAIFVHDVIVRNDKSLPLYEKIVSDKLPRAIVIPVADTLSVTLRQQDLSWQDFLTGNTAFNAVPCQPHDYSNILFSSGTTGIPKAIPWTHTTPIRCASDAYFHQDIHPGDVLCWPTNLGWMMGPWLIYAALINQATIALYTDTPNTQQFGEFVARNKITMLGLVPSLVKNWRVTGCMEELDWSHIKTFSSSGECSNPDDMLYLMSLAGYKPIIEYCGGTEIGGAYISSTVVEPNVPSLFSTATMGTKFAIIDEQGKPADSGEVILFSPSIGFSTQLLNRDHHQEYFADIKPWQEDLVLRKHGDKIKRIGAYYRLEGRSDDTMNLGGIKTSSAEIERLLNTLDGIQETAAIAVTTEEGGPELLVIFCVLQNGQRIDKPLIHATMQSVLKNKLNPLFKIHDTVVVAQLPKTASNKIMRKELRKLYLSH